nr:ankyrin repeat domain-containing protein 60 [Vicugna pacos]
MRVLLEDSEEMFRVTNCRSDMTVRELKEELDLMAGIPFNLQRLQFLDQGILMDDAPLKFYGVVPGGIISLCVWHYDGWTDLVLAAVEGDSSKLSFLGVTEDSFYQTANSQRFNNQQWKTWVSQRAFVALYIASHRGHVEVVQYLLEHGANCLGRTPVGRTPLHVAAAMGRLDCVSLLLNHGASVNARDAKGETPMSVARRLSGSQSKRRMFLFYWMTKLGTKGLTNPVMNKGFQRLKTGFGSKKESQK